MRVKFETTKKPNENVCDEREDSERREGDDSDFHCPSDIPPRLGGCETPANC